MKKGILIALAVVLAAVLAVVVFEVIEIVTYSVPTVRLSPKTAYVVAYDGGFWFETGGDVNAPTAVGHDAGTSIPANYDVVIATGWVGTSLDQIKDVSQNIKMRIPEAGMDMSYDRGVGGPSDSTAFGSSPTLYDEYWVKLLLPITGFKPQSGAQVYAVHWAVPLTGGELPAKNLTADGKLPQGTYTVYYEETVEGPMAGLDGIYDGQKTPYHATQGTTVTAPYTFTVGPPAASPGPAASSSPAVSTSPPAEGAKAAVSYVQPPSPLPRANPASVCGWTFRPTVDIAVTELGCYDEDQDGLARSHRVGIFDARTERLLGSVHVGPGSTLDGAFRYESLDRPVVLKAGKSYLVGAETLGTGEPEKPSEVVYWVKSPDEDSWAPEIAFGELRTNLGSTSTSSGFSVPTDPRPGLHMFMSPNFKFMPRSASSPTP
jgi:FlaG/FlaF family flagellin (archaellin)